MQKTVVIFRGVSGSGKSTFAKLLTSLIPNSAYVEADSFFEDDKDNYNFDPKKLNEAHLKCQRDFVTQLSSDKDLVIVSNTNTKVKDFQFYVDMAYDYGYQVVFLVVENRHGGKSVHSVPEQTLNFQASNIKNSLSLFLPAMLDLSVPQTR